MRGGVAILVVLWLASAAEAKPSGGVVPYRTVFLNRCANGCSVRPGFSNSIEDTWEIDGPHVLTAFPFDDAVWNEVVGCVRDVFAPYQIDVVSIDPGTAPHFEAMVAGSPVELNLKSSLLGVAPWGCSTTYRDNGLVFAFASRIKEYKGYTSCDGRCVDEICSVISQELGHVWASMDHVAVAADPMTYFDYDGRKYFQDVDAQCGSDCVFGLSPDGLACTGQAHRCICTMSQTQNSHQLVGSLFGLTPTTPEIECHEDRDCETSTDVCIGGRCAPGASVAGGLGQTCSLAADCLSYQCANDGVESRCVESCNAGQCPSGFGCQPVEGSETGVCWPGYDDSGCGCRSANPGSTSLLALSLMLLLRRRRSGYQRSRN